MQSPLRIDADHHAGLTEAIADARLLLGYAVRTTRKVDPVLIERVTATAAALEQALAAGTYANRLETEFLHSYNELASAATPISANSIRQTAAVAHQQLRSPTFIPVLFSVAFLLIVLVLQAYWVVGKSLREQLRGFEDVKKTVSQQLDGAGDALRKAEEKKERLAGRVREGEQPASGVAATDRTRARLELELIENDVAQSRDTKRRLERDLKQVNDETSPVEQSLMRWYGAFFGWDKWRKAYEDAQAKLQQEMAELETKRKVAPAPSGGGLLGMSDRFLAQLMERRDLDRQTERVSDKLRRNQFELSRTLQHRVDIVLETLQRYVIPLLLGLLGALTYILRLLVTRLSDFSYTAASAGLTFVRICLGMMAGVLGSIFVPAGESVLKTLPPLVIPFIFGYAVEMLFTFLDRAVGAFVASDGRTSRA